MLCGAVGRWDSVEVSEDPSSLISLSPSSPPAFVSVLDFYCVSQCDSDVSILHFICSISEHLANICCDIAAILLV